MKYCALLLLSSSLFAMEKEAPKDQMRRQLMEETRDFNSFKRDATSRLEELNKNVTRTTNEFSHITARLEAHDDNFKGAGQLFDEHEQIAQELKKELEALQKKTNSAHNDIATLKEKCESLENWNLGLTIGGGIMAIAGFVGLVKLYNLWKEDNTLPRSYADENGYIYLWFPRSGIKRYLQVGNSYVKGVIK